MTVEKVTFFLLAVVLLICPFCFGSEVSPPSPTHLSLYYPKTLAKKIEKYENSRFQSACSELQSYIDGLMLALENRSPTELSRILTELEKYQRITDPEFRPVVKELHNRVVIWEQFLDILNIEPKIKYTENLTTQELYELYVQTDKICNSLKKVQNGRECIRFFKLDLLHDQLSHLMFLHDLFDKTENGDEFLSSQAGTNKSIFKKTNGEVVINETEISQLLSIINEIVYLERQVAENPLWQDFVNSPTVINWKKCLTRWHSDLIDPFHYLCIYERYLSDGAVSDGILLAQLTPHMIRSRSLQCQKIGQIVKEQFSNPHLKLYVSRFLLNRLLPTRDPEFDVVRDSIAGQQVFGRRRTDTQVQLDLIPDPERLMMSLNISGKVQTSTTASTFPATIQNQSHANYLGKKRMEWTADGIRVSPAEVSVFNNKVQLRNVSTDFDIVPFFGGFIKDIAISQYENQKGVFESETKRKILNQAKYRIDQEVDERLQIFNSHYQRSFVNILHSCDASLQQKQCRTTEDWLMTSWFFATPVSLGSHVPEPETPAGAIADLKIHQSAVNAVIERLDLAGQCFTIGELRTHLLKRIQQEDLGQPGDNDHVLIAFKKENPIMVRFEPDKVSFSLAIDFLQIDEREWCDFQVFVHYVPGTSSNGKVCLIRDGYIQLKGENNFRTQMALRTIFSKIFNDYNEIPLSPKLFQQDERFSEICTDYVRIHDGWFAIALSMQSTLVKQENTNIVTK